jgi:hypothetical protein
LVSLEVKAGENDRLPHLKAWEARTAISERRDWGEDYGGVRRTYRE